AFMRDTSGEPAQYLRFHAPGDGGDVIFADTVTRMRQVQAEIAVIREENQAFALLVEASDGIKIAPFLRQKLADGVAVQFIPAGAEIAGGFVQRDVKLAFDPEGAAIHDD